MTYNIYDDLGTCIADDLSRQSVINFANQRSDYNHTFADACDSIIENGGQVESI